MNKRDLQWLERIFVAEIYGNLPFQSKAKRLTELETEGYVQRDSMIISGQFPVVIKGWALTHLGRLTYCATCAENEPDASRVAGTNRSK